MVGIQISFTSQIKKNDVKLTVLTRYTSRFSLNGILTENEKSHWYQQTKRKRSTRSALWLNVVPTVTLAGQCSVPVSLCFPSILWCVVIILVTVCVTADITHIKACLGRDSTNSCLVLPKTKA